MKHKRKGPKKSFVQQREENFLEKSHGEAEIHCKTLRRGKNLASIEETCLEKEKMRSRVTPRTVGVGMKSKGKLNKRRCG